MKKLLTTLALWLVYVPAVHAADLGGGILDEVAGKANIKSDAGLPEVVGNLIKIFIGLLGIIFLVLSVYAGFLYLTAQGDKDKVQKAKDTLQRGVIGLIIISAAYAITAFVIGALNGAANSST